MPNNKVLTIKNLNHAEQFLSYINQKRVLKKALFLSLFKIYTKKMKIIKNHFL